MEVAHRIVQADVAVLEVIVPDPDVQRVAVPSEDPVLAHPLEPIPKHGVLGLPATTAGQPAAELDARTHIAEAQVGELTVRREVYPLDRGRPRPCSYRRR